MASSWPTWPSSPRRPPSPCCDWPAPTTGPAGDSHEAAFRRLATAVAKYWLCKRQPPMVAEALECLGGNGYIEESIMPRLFRESPLNGIWEGSGNVICLDVLRAMARQPQSVTALFDEVGARRGRRRPTGRGRRSPSGRVVRHRPPRRPGPPDGGENGPGTARAAAGSFRPSRGGRSLLRLTPARRLGPGVRDLAPGGGHFGHHRAGHTQAWLIRIARAGCGLLGGASRGVRSIP